MSKTLGLDLGTNSLGWAVLDDVSGDILDKGVVVFPEGIDASSDTLETPAAIRRAKRMGRRMKFRRKMRKWVLLRILIENGMCPMTMDELKAWKSEGRYPVDNREFISWLKSTDTTNPYRDRADAASGKVEPFVLGRALYHICQRRGFKSSRKDAGEEDSSDKDLGKVKGDIAALTKAISDAGCKTLGQYFAKCIDAQKDQMAKERVRTRYTGRIEHYEVEFSVIMKAQGYAGTELATALHDAIFYQRPLRSQKHLVGPCPLEPRSPRAQISHPDYEEFRMLSLVNNLSFENIDTDERVALTAEDRAIAARAFMKASPTMKFKDVSKLFKKKFAAENLRFHYYRDDETVSCCSIRHQLNKAFGDVRFDEQSVFDALSFFDNDEMLAGWFRRHYPDLTQEQVKALCRIHPKEGNASYSLKAIRKVLPFLRKGYVLSTARFLAKLPEVIKDFPANEEQITLNLKELEIEYHRLRDEQRDPKTRRKCEPVRLTDLYRKYFLERWNVQDEDWNRLYLRGDAAYEVDPDHPERLPHVQLGMIRNPLVQRSMTTLRRLVNYLRDHEIIDADTTIRIELARSVNDFATRHAIQLWQQDRQKERDAARAELGVNCTEDAVDRYLLAKEQEFKCLYTGKSISVKEILAGNVFDIEHTIPRSMSGDDSMANKTLCDAEYNRKLKKGMVPTQCPGYEQMIYINLGPWRSKVADLEKTYRSQKGKVKFLADPAAKSMARIKAIRTRLELDYWRDKLRRFEVTPERLADPENGLSGFKKRQLVDSGIMSSHAVELLKSVYRQVYAVNGTATAFARKAWGIQDDAVKDRSEHTHHAKDAMVIAALTPPRFNAICTALKDDGTDSYRRACDVCKPPYPDFAEKVRAATGEILVKHVVRQTTLRQSSKRNALAKAHASKSEPGKVVKYVLSRGDTVRGQLHLDTFYGCITDPEDGNQKKVVRKPLVGAVKAAEAVVDKIVDPAIRSIVSAGIERIKAEGRKNIEPGDIRMPSGVPINKVRIYAANATNASTLGVQTMKSSADYKNHYYVTSSPGSNFRLGVFKVGDRYSVVPDNALDWAQHHKEAGYSPLHEREGFVGYILPGAMAITTKDGSIREPLGLDAKELPNRLYKVVKFRSDGLITFRRHSEARASVVLAKDLLEAGKHKAGESSVDFDSPHELLLMSPGAYFKCVLFEGIHFRMTIDGKIHVMQ